MQKGSNDSEKKETAKPVSKSQKIMDDLMASIEAEKQKPKKEIKPKVASHIVQPPKPIGKPLDELISQKRNARGELFLELRSYCLISFLERLPFSKSCSSRPAKRPE